MRSITICRVIILSVEVLFSEFIERSLQVASRMARDSFGKVSVTTKPEDNNQVLTQADIDIGAMLVSAVQEQFPEHNIIDEEAGTVDKNSRYTWVIDPIDGTSNFANGVPTYAVMMGLLDGTVPVAGGIALPSFGQTYVAAKGKGAYCNGISVHVTAENKLSNALVAYGIDGYQEDPKITYDETAALADIVLAIRNLRGSNSAYDLALVADGRYGACIIKTGKIWDTVATQIVIEEAGGVFTDYDGRAIDYSRPLSRIGDNFSLCAGAPPLHAQLQAIIHKDLKN